MRFDAFSFNPLLSNNKLLFFRDFHSVTFSVTCRRVNAILEEDKDSILGHEFFGNFGSVLKYQFTNVERLDLLLSRFVLDSR